MNKNNNRITISSILLIALVIPSGIFAQLFGGQIKTNKNWTSIYPAGSVFCSSGPTAVVDVINPTTGKIWMDRNLGASQAATSNTDQNAYGDLYQWGRRNDGHQCRNSIVTYTLSSIDQPIHGDFIATDASSTAPKMDWRVPQNNNLWQGLNGVNNPCPTGYRIPTYAELDSERASWTNQNATGAFNSPLKLTLAGFRSCFQGGLFQVDTQGSYHSSNYYLPSSYWTCGGMTIGVTNISMYNNGDRGAARSVRCKKN
jgi:hypothetical protein